MPKAPPRSFTLADEGDTWEINILRHPGDLFQEAAVQPQGPFGVKQQQPKEAQASEAGDREVPEVQVAQYQYL